MMSVHFRRQAEADLRNIVEWYKGAAPESVGNILADIYRSIDQLIDFPRSGVKVPGQPLRRIVTHRYHFKIAYEVEGNSVVIVGIFRFQNRNT